MDRPLECIERLFNDLTLCCIWTEEIDGRRIIDVITREVDCNDFAMLVHTRDPSGELLLGVRSELPYGDVVFWSEDEEHPGIDPSKYYEGLNVIPVTWLGNDITDGADETKSRKIASEVWVDRINSGLEEG